MPSFQKFHSLCEALAHGKHDFSTDQIKVALSNVEPDITTDAVLADITEISYANIVDGGTTGRDAVLISSSQTGGLYKLILDVLTLVASGAVPEFQYIIVYNDDAPAKELLGYYINPDPVNMIAPNEFGINFSPTNGELQIV